VDTATTALAWNVKEAQDFVEKNIRIPTVATHDWLAPLAVLGVMKSPKEQGEWAAHTALKILAGENPKEIPITKNQHDWLYINQTLAKKLGINFPVEVLKSATQIIP
jgi:ABC-type uncharacterized transport system substrate-binding protein